MKKRRTLIAIIIAFVILCMHILICIMVPVTMVRVPSDIKFTNEYNPDAYLCLPAAYTSTDGSIEGLYRINGKTQGSKSLKEYAVSPTVFEIIFGPIPIENSLTRTPAHFAVAKCPNS